MKQRLDVKEDAIDQKIEVKVGSRSLIIEQRELNDLMEAMSQMKTLAARGRSLMNVGTA
jgi:hypothetical protein